MFNISCVLATATFQSSTLIFQQFFLCFKRLYIDVMERQVETWSLWHDSKEHMKLIDALVSSEDKAKARGYFDDISVSFEAIDNTVDTINTLIDSILIN